MGKLMITPGGGGISSDEVTATKAHVLSGKTTITQDSNDEIVGGTMPDRGAWNSNVAMNGSVAVPQGHHNGNGKVNGPVITDRGAWGTNIGINGRATIPQGYHSGGGSVGQSIPVQGADVAGTDRALATNISAWNGTMCSGVRNGHYLNGVNWIQANVPNLTAGNIKKGVNIAGLIGTFEGWVPTATDLYLRGHNPAGFKIRTDWLQFDAGQITVIANRSNAWVDLICGVKYNLSGFTRWNMECVLYSSNYYTSDNVGLFVTDSTDIPAGSPAPDVSIFMGKNVTYYNVSLDISAWDAIKYIHARIKGPVINNRIYRIWLS